jgi:hypothetical protein
VNIGHFWQLVDECRGGARGRAERVTWLRADLEQKSIQEIVAFQVCLDRQSERAFTWELWCAAERIFGGWCSDDGFCYFRLWVVGLGRTPFERAVQDPDSLADTPEVQALVGRPRTSWGDGWPEWEQLDYVAAEAYEQVTGSTDDGASFYDLVEAHQRGDNVNRDPLGERWDVRDEVEAARRLPRLSTMFPV